MKKEINYPISNENILLETIEETNKITKYFLNLIIILGSLSFLIVGLSSYNSNTIIPFLKAEEITFFPQGLTMTFYGILGTLISINQSIILLSKVGEGFNEFNKEKGTMTIFRKGLPGKNKDINITYPITDIVRYLKSIEKSREKRNYKIKLNFSKTPLN